MQPMMDLIVFSHLRWDFVWQRPQHLLTRLAADRRIFFIEEPLHTLDGEASWSCRNPQENLIVCQPRTPISSPGFSPNQLPVLRSLIQKLLEEYQIGEYQVWFYTPMAFPLLRDLTPRGVIYDCMDELSAFRGAPPELLGLEAELLRRTDLVFTGGPSLYRSKRDRHPDVHCFPSSVDLAHFSRARSGIEEPEEQKSIPHPRLGFFGVIDERLDIPLIDHLAQSHPDWQIVLVGPVVKIDPEMLPRRSNLHYLGQRAYLDLPGFLSGWDVSLLPFALNESTKFISPTKTLEYMAAGKPIVSTPITDVADLYPEIVYLADSPEAFVTACERALTANDEERSKRAGKAQEVLAGTSWDETAAAMSSLMERIARPRLKKQLTDVPPVVVIGAGPTGLSTAYHLGDEALLLEQNDRVGGWCRSIEENGFTFDFAGHIMFSNDPYVHQMYQMLLGDNVHWQDREAWVFSKGVYTRYPFQGALYGLPPDVIKECILGAIESRFGPLKKSKDNASLTQTASTPGTNSHSGNGTSSNGHAANGHLTNGRNGHTKESNGDSWCKPGSVQDCCGDGVMESTAKLVKAEGHRPGSSSETPANFEEFIYKVWGAGIARHFAIPYNRKLWAVPLTEMETSWLGGRVPLPDLEEMLEGALRPVAKPMGPNARFGYPLRGGFQALMDGFLPHLTGPVRYNSRVARVSPSRHTIELQDGTEIPYEQLVSTMPLPVLIRLIGEEAPEEVRRAAAGLRYISVRCVHLGVGRANLTEKHWIYYPEDTVFHRIFVQGNASPHCNAPGGFGLTCEITYHPEYKPLPCDGNELIDRCIADCRRVGIFGNDDPIVAAKQVDMPHAYVVYDHARLKNVNLLRSWLEARDILLAGRYSEWEYYNSDHAFLAGKKVAEKVQALRPGREVKSDPELALA